MKSKYFWILFSVWLVLQGSVCYGIFGMPDLPQGEARPLIVKNAEEGKDLEGQEHLDIFPQGSEPRLSIKSFIRYWRWDKTQEQKDALVAQHASYAEGSTLEIQRMLQEDPHYVKLVLEYYELQDAAILFSNLNNRIFNVLSTLDMNEDQRRIRTQNYEYIKKIDGITESLYAALDLYQQLVIERVLPDAQPHAEALVGGMAGLSLQP